MLEQVENKILELKKIQAEEYYKRKDADLQAWGLTYKTDGNKVTPIIVTDEEYETYLDNMLTSSGFKNEKEFKDYAGMSLKKYAKENKLDRDLLLTKELDVIYERLLKK